MQLQRLIRLSLLLGVAVVLYRFSFSLPGFPPFLKYDTSEVPVLVASLAYGPLYGMLLELLKNLLHALLKGGANPIGLAANFIAGLLMIAGVTSVYRLGGQRRWLAILSGALLMGLAMIPLNLYLFLPAHGIAPSKLTAMAVSALTPFNLAKGVLSSWLGLVLYERVALLFRKSERPQGL